MYIENHNFYTGSDNKSNLIERQFVWSEMEYVRNSELFDIVNRETKDAYNNFYFLTAMSYDYPKSFKVKYWGLWKNIIQKYGIEITESFEKEVQFPRYGMIYGSCKTYFTKAIIDILANSSFYTVLIFTNNKYNINYIVEDDFISVEESKINIHFGRIINSFGQQGDLIVTLVYGPGESSLNIIKQE